MIIVGLGFGDEGKGLATSYFANKLANSIVIRFNGGHQAGHTVVYNNHRHVFSSFGSGTLQNIPTYYSKECVFSPSSFLKEYDALMTALKTPPLYHLHAMCQVTTPFDVYGNIVNSTNGHGTVGVGFGATIQRSEEYFKLFVRDLYYEKIMKQKLRNIYQVYYKDLLPIFKQNKVSITDLIEQFITDAKRITTLVDLVKDELDEFSILDQTCDNIIFEGAQGVMLDMDHGFFPNVTRSNTTSKNAISLIDREIIANTDNIEVCYVTRTYQTRHGNGYMSNESLPFPTLKNCENETNVTHRYQGEFRKSLLDIDQLKYAIDCDDYYSARFSKNLMITCIDQTTESFDVTINNEVKKITVDELPKLLNVRFNKVYLSYGDDFTKIKEL